MPDDAVTSPDELLRLAERCEKAARPDRALDRAILGTLNLTGTPPPFWITDNAGDAVPAMFTASLDAAMTLVPEGWVYSGHEHLDGVHTWDLNDRNSARVEVAEAATPALALCAAAIRARYQEKGR